MASRPDGMSGRLGGGEGRNNIDRSAPAVNESWLYDSFSDWGFAQ